MNEVQQSLAAAAYGMFALEQPLTLPELAAAAAASTFPLGAKQTPDWFAAAASGESSLVDMAPELQVLPVDAGETEHVDVSGLDLIHVYAPELTAIEEIEPEPPLVKPAPHPVEQPRTSTQIGLLKELEDLDT